MPPVAVRTIDRAPADLIARLGKLGVATVHEAMGREGLMKAYMRPLWRGAQIAGSAVTVLTQPGDNWMVHVAIELCKPGDVMVVAVGSDCTDGMVGDLLGTSLMARGVAGLVLDTGCRDARQLTGMKFPVWSKAISARGTVKESLGSVNLPVVCAGVAVRPGDVVVADDDGVVVVPRLQAEGVALEGERREVRENQDRIRYAAGEVSLDVKSMRPKLASAGLVYVERMEELDIEGL